MKKILTFTLAFALVAFTLSSCKKDKKEEPVMEKVENTVWDGTYEESGEQNLIVLEFKNGTEFILHQYFNITKNNERVTHWVHEGTYTYNKPNLVLTPTDAYPGGEPKSSTSKGPGDITWKGVVSATNELTLNLQPGLGITVPVKLKIADLK